MAATETNDAGLLVLNNFILGSFEAPRSGCYLDGYEPATGEVFCSVADSNEEDVDLAVAAARQAFPFWSGLTDEARSRYLYRVADLIESRLEEFAVAESRDNGKPVSLARTVDIPRAVLNFRFFAGAILHHEERSTTQNGGQVLNYSLRQPVGVAGLISPWNLPLYLLSWKIAPALAVGNTVVAKPSEFTSLTAVMLCQVFNDAGVPPGVLNVVLGRGASAGARLVAHPLVPLISFTGGTVTGEKVMVGAARCFKKLSLELGGKNPNIIFDDADLEQAVATSVRSSFANQGEICLCGSRIFVQRGVYQRFIDAFAAAVQATLRVGDPNDPATTTGALISLEHRQKVEYYIDLARQQGGRILVGGERPADLPPRCRGGYFVQPTVVVDLPYDARAQLEEIFGPVVTVTPFDSEDQVVEWANCVQYGLSASIWTRDLSRAHRVAAAVQAGTVWINCWLQRDLRMPFGGMKYSGIGREGGEHSIDFYTQAKCVSIQLSRM